MAVSGYQSPGDPTGFVNDFALMLGETERSTLEQKLSTYATQTKNEVVVVTVQNLGGDTIENFTEKLLKEWGIGKEKEDNGVLLLISKEDREMRIEVGYGLEGDLTDIFASRLIRETLTPAFKKGEFFNGIDTATTQIMQTLGGETVEFQDESSSYSTKISDYGNFIFFAFFVFISFLSSILGRSKSWWAGGVVGLIIAIILGFVFTLFLAIISAVILIPLGLLFDYIVSKKYKESTGNNRRPPWWIGGGGFGGGGRGFGGFGGGMSGGGGASGRW